MVTSLDPSDDLKSVTTGLTASVTQEQGQVPLVSDLNEFTTVANDGDATTLPSAVGGKEVTIVNDGANDLNIFPALDDDLGNGVDIPILLEPNESFEFISFNSTTWRIEASTEVFHGEMHVTDNTTEYSITDTGGDHYAYHGNMIVGDLAGWTFDAGGTAQFPIASIADAGGGDITVTTTGAHGLAINDIISQTNLADAAYVGFFKILTVPTTTTYTVTAVFTATDTGSMDQASTLTVQDIAIGVYKITWSGSGTSVANNKTFDFFLHNGVNEVIGSRGRNKFGTGGDFSFLTGQGLAEIGSGDKILLAFANQDDATNFTMRDLSIIVTRL